MHHFWNALSTWAVGGGREMDARLRISGRKENPPSKSQGRGSFLLVARRELRWLLHDQVALILIFGVPLFAFVVLGAVFSNP